VIVHHVELAGIAAVSACVFVGVVACSRRFASGPRLSAPGTGLRWFRLSLPETFDREGPVAFFETVSELLRPVFLGADPSVGFTCTAVGPPLALTAAEAAALLPLPSRLADTRMVLAEAPARRLAPAADAPPIGIRLGKVER
jgi:hypothetical protein